jgi:ribonuclease E
MPETLVPGFDSPPSLALEREFAASEGDYSLSGQPEDQVFDKDTTAEPTRVAAARDDDVEAPAPDVTSAAEPMAESSALGQADAAAEAPASAPAANEPPRPRRSGWWQRARATVIGK